MSLARFAACLVPLLFAAEAAAQPSILFESRDSGDLAVEGVNRADCRDGEAWEFTHHCTGCTNVAVWIGDNCDLAENRTSANPSCGELVPLQTPDARGDTLIVYAGYAPEETEPTFTDPLGTSETDCPEVDTTTSIFVLELQDASDDALSFSEHTVLVDTDPPAAPVDVEAAPGEGSVTVSWSTEENLPAEDRDGFQVVCHPDPDLADPPPLPDAGPDAGAGAACAGGFSAGSEAAEDDFCGGRQGATARSLRIDHLHNGGGYQFGVIAYDDFDNPSVVSEVVCTTPRPVEDFFEAYRRTGGKAGGGLCSAVPGRGASPPAAPLGPVVLLALAVLSRRRSR